MLFIRQEMLEEHFLPDEHEERRLWLCSEKEGCGCVREKKLVAVLIKGGEEENL
jgi:hypothetical protein